MSTPKILLADESRFFTELERQFLKQTHVEVSVARSAAEVVELSRKIRPVLIYLAFTLAGENGAKCCRTLKTDAELKKIPVILLGDGSKESELEHCRAAGADGLLTKPIDRRTFLEMGRRFLQVVDRRQPRISCRTPVFFSLLGQNGYGTIIDLSAGGVFIDYSKPVRPETRIQLSFMLPGLTDAVVGAAGRVAWVNAGPHLARADMPPGFGVEFLDLSAESARLVQSFLINQGA